MRHHELSEEEVVIQTRNTQNLILQSFKKGTILPLYRAEMEDRKLLGYPPFGRVAKLKLNARSAHARDRVELVKERFKNYQKEIYPSLLNSKDGEIIVILIKSSLEEDWKILFEELAHLPPDISVDAQPTSYL
jgi:primosomal protein N'